jgi:hypothetical protein
MLLLIRNVNFQINRIKNFQFQNNLSVIYICNFIFLYKKSGHKENEEKFLYKQFFIKTKIVN